MWKTNEVLNYSDTLDLVPVIRLSKWVRIRWSTSWASKKQRHDVGV